MFFLKYFLLTGILGYIQVMLDLLASEDRDIMSRVNKYKKTLSKLDSMESLQELTDIIDELEQKGIVFNSLEIEPLPKRKWVRIFKRVWRWRRKFMPSPPPRESKQDERRRIEMDRLCQLERERQEEFIRMRNEELEEEFMQNEELEEEFMRMRNEERESKSKIIMWDESELEEIPEDEKDTWWM